MTRRGGWERNGVNCVTGKLDLILVGEMYLISFWLEYVSTRCSSFKKRIFWDLIGVAVVKECCVGPVFTPFDRPTCVIILKRKWV